MTSLNLTAPRRLIRHQPRPSSPDLVMVGHGSRDAGAGRVLHQLRDAVAARVPHQRVQLAWLEHHTPLLTDVLQNPAIEGGASPVVVPLLLSRGRHLSRDLPADAAPALGPHPLLTEILLDRIRTAGIAPGTPLALAATGSQDPAGIADVHAQAGLLQAAWQAPVRAGFVTATPHLTAVTQDLEQAHGRQPAVVSYFLAPGRLPGSARAATAHLGDHPALVDLVLTRYYCAVRARACSAQGLGGAATRSLGEPPFAPDGVTRMGL